MKPFVALCILVVTVNLCLVWSASLDDEKTFGFNYNGLFKFKKPLFPTTTNPTTTRRMQRICPGNNPPPVCRTPDLCTRDSECFANEICCRIYFAGQLLNSSCCVSNIRGLQCPATVDTNTCANSAQCGGSSECPPDQICCAVDGSATVRCCINPVCPSPITTTNQCNTAIVALCSETPNLCGQNEICCWAGAATFPCCADISNSPPFIIH